MELYVFLFVLILLFSLLDFTNITIYYKKCVLICISLVLILLSAVRWKTGTDWDMYYYLYINNNTICDYWITSNNVQAQEFGYGILNWLVKNTLDDYNILLLVIATIILIIKYNWYTKYMSFPLVAFFVNFSTYLGDVFFVRQTLSIAITIVAFQCIIKRKLVLFLVFVFVASSMHASALIFIPAYWIYHARISSKKMGFFIMTCLCVDIFKINTIMLSSFLDMFPSDTGKIVQKVWEYYLLEQNGEGFGNAMDNSVRMIFAYSRRVMLIPFYMFFSSVISKRNMYYLGCLNLVIFGHMLFFLTSMIGMDFAGRLAAYYYVYEVLLISSLLLTCENNLKRMAIYAVIVIYCFVKYVYVIYNLGSAYIPYMHVF